jgi:hypothetical protein
MPSLLCLATRSESSSFFPKLVVCTSNRFPFVGHRLERGNDDLLLCSAGRPHHSAGFSERVNRTTYRVYYEVYDPGVYSMQVAVEFATAWGTWDRSFFEQVGKPNKGSPEPDALTEAD